MIEGGKNEGKEIQRAGDEWTGEGRFVTYKGVLSL